MLPSRRFLALGALLPTLLGCAAEEDGAESFAAAVEREEEERGVPEDAPSYDGDGFTGARLFRIADATWIDEATFDEVLADARIVFFGEQHQTAPVQALERWVFAKVAERHPDAGLAMEHFQADEQPVIDRYFRGEIDGATFEAQSQPWAGYATYWRPLVEDAREAERPLFALNVPKEVLDSIYAQFPTRPLQAFDRIAATSPFAPSLPPRPLAPWDAIYGAWFERSYDYATHGASWGLAYADALRYFTDLAHIRDETMAYWTARASSTNPHLLVVAGDWHVRTGHALPLRVERLLPDAARVLVTTAPEPRFDEVRAVHHAERAVADYILTYR